MHENDVVYRPGTTDLPCTVQSPPSFQCLVDTLAVTDPMNLVFPYVLLWNPLVQFPLLSKEIEMCPHENCTGKLVFFEWSNGRTKSIQPRLLHDTHHLILLVGAIYTCSDTNHKVHSTDPRLISKLDSTILPFHLLHRSGFSHEFVTSVVNLAKEGLPIARHIQKQREEFAGDLISMLVQCYLYHSGVHFTQVQILQFLKSESLRSLIQPFPSNDIIARCFFIHFQKYELSYLSHMGNTKIKKCIRLDHTFKVASNIGYLRSDGRWVTMYESTFIVLNEEGIVVAWQFTKTTSLEEVKPLLLSLRHRIEMSEKEPLTVYVDNCCQVRRKIQEIFGNNVVVKLDLFHAVQRVSRAMSKQHTLYFPCVRDFTMTLRNSADKGKRRTMHTPDIDVIEHNIQQFLTIWSKTELNVITPKVARQIHLLQAHITHGCLSNIEPGGGTNYNEALHRFINPHFLHAGRIGLPLAYALLTILFHVHNCKKGKKNTLADTLSMKLGFDTSPTPSKFGVVPKYHPNTSMNTRRISCL